MAARRRASPCAERESAVSPYRVAPGVHWIVGRTALTILDGNGAARTLGYPEAAVWDFVTRGYSLCDVSRLIAPVASLDPPAARQVVQAAVDGWIASGFLERA